MLVHLRITSTKWIWQIPYKHKIWRAWALLINPQFESKSFDSWWRLNLFGEILWDYLHLGKVFTKFEIFWSWFERIMDFWQSTQFAQDIPDQPDIHIGQVRNSNLGVLSSNFVGCFSLSVSNFMIFVYHLIGFCPFLLKQLQLKNTGPVQFNIGLARYLNFGIWIWFLVSCFIMVLWAYVSNFIMFGYHLLSFHFFSQNCLS